MSFLRKWDSTVTPSRHPSCPWLHVYYYTFLSIYYYTFLGSSELNVTNKVTNLGNILLPLSIFLGIDFSIHNIRSQNLLGLRFSILIKLRNQKIFHCLIQYSLVPFLGCYGLYVLNAWLKFDSFTNIRLYQNKIYGKLVAKFFFSAL